jgi:hypothetical protein
LKARTLVQGIIACAATAVGFALPASAGADTFTVTTTDESGPGSLRQAIADANAHPGHNTVNFAPSGQGQIFMPGASSDTALTITGDVDVDGPGMGKLSLFSGQGRIFKVTSSAKATISGMTLDAANIFDANATGPHVLNQGTLTLSGLLLQNANAIAPPGGHASGGSIANSGTLTLQNSTMTRNFASSRDGGSGQAGDTAGGAIANSGTMTIDHTSLINNLARSGDTFAGGVLGAEAKGGAIANTGDLTVLDSTLNDNIASAGAARDEGGTGVGGGIYNAGRGVLTVRGSTLVSNLAGGGAGGVAGGAIGGAIENFDPATFKLADSTIVQNGAVPGAGSHQADQSAGGGIDNQSTFQNQSTIVGTTITMNDAYRGSNIQNTFASLSLQDTIVANPRRPDGSPGAQNCGHPSSFPSAIQSLGYNIDSDASCELKATGDKSATDPQLKDLADNGGATQTMAIPLSSPALDQGVSGGLTTDQRGEKRPVIVPGTPKPTGGDGSDIGAYEYQPGPAGFSRIKGSVKPGRTHAGERTCFEFKAKRATGGPMANVQVKMGGKRARTDEKGKATVCKKFKEAGVRHPRLRKRGHERAKLRVAVRP